MYAQSLTNINAQKLCCVEVGGSGQQEHFSEGRYLNFPACTTASLVEDNPPKKKN